MSTPWTKNQVPIDNLMEGSVAQRLVAFYQAYGPTAQKGFIKYASAEQVARAIGLTGGGRVRRVQQERQRLVKQGKLIKVTKGKLYTWDYTWKGISDEALEAMNEIDGGEHHKFVRPGEAWKARLDEFPAVSLFCIKGRTPWWRKLTGLFDMADDDVLEFWAAKFTSAVNANTNIKGKGKYQNALYAVESGVNRNLKSNPNWTSGKGDVAFVLDAVRNYVGNERDWALPTSDQRDKMKELEKSEGTSLIDYIIQNESSRKVKKGETIHVPGKKPEKPEGVEMFGAPVEEDRGAKITDDLQAYLAYAQGGEDYNYDEEVKKNREAEELLE